MTVDTPIQATNDFLLHWQNMLKAACDNLMTAKQRQAQYADQHRKEVEFHVNNKVLLSTKHIHNPVDRNRPTAKFAPKFIGPYRVAQVISKVTYKLDLPSTLPVHLFFTYHC